MAIIVNIYYSGENDSARKFVDEMETSGIADAIRSSKGNLRYDYFLPYHDSQTVLLIDCWENQEALDRHHQSDMMAKIIRLRDKYDLKMHVERYISDNIPDYDATFIR